MKSNVARDTLFFKTFSQFLCRFPISSHDKIIVAVSGGPDSVCLLYLLRVYFERFAKTKWETEGYPSLHVAHLNHSFRPEADEEAAFVSDLCRSWGIACTVDKRPVLDICKEKRLSKQEGARFVRYDFLITVAKTEQARWIALGHTADDHAETFLMNLLRGTGGDGLSGIPKIREGKIIRPLLHATREEILACLRENHIPFRFDPSNQDKRYLRNRIRHDLIPMLQTYNPNIKKTIVRIASVLTEETSFFNEHISALIPEKTFCATQNDIAFDLTLFCPLHKAIQRRLIRHGIRHLCGNLRGIRFDHIETILKIIPGSDEKLFSLAGLAVHKMGTRLLMKRPPPPVISKEQVEIPDATLHNLQSGSITVQLPAWKIGLSLSLKNRLESIQYKETDDCSAFFDFDTMAYPITVRGWRVGDQFAPLGMQGRHKKLQDFFIDQKINKERRSQIPIMDCPKGIIWVIGYRMDDRFKITEKTKRILSLSVEESGTTSARR